RTCKSILDKLPIENHARVWKEEIYFEIPVNVDDENSTTFVKKGDIAYYPPMNAFCIFFGNSQPIGPVNLIGKLNKPDMFSLVKNRDTIRLELYEDE
ncbi:MAG TPA: hypothetical protein EYP86_03425, partial [Candidatus Altiarchaeales archaeon]|nr:hypothetical protein [Candidatus Altiarchaeales archaeon]